MAAATGDCEWGHQPHSRSSQASHLLLPSARASKATETTAAATSTRAAIAAAIHCNRGLHCCVQVQPPHGAMGPIATACYWYFLYVLEIYSSSIIIKSHHLIPGRKSENITQNPYSVKEGDQFCVHIISGSMNKAGGMQPPTTTNIARPEDLDLKILREEEKQQKEEKKRSKKVLFLDNPDNILVPRRKETLLMIGRGGEFSDEDEDEDGGGAPGRKCF